MRKSRRARGDRVEGREKGICPYVIHIYIYEGRLGAGILCARVVYRVNALVPPRSHAATVKTSSPCPSRYNF